ncbi:MAG: cadherin repeat domain-containing protein [Magnetococcales bacterium]|nr:cadherin repeat domain-containing protein [Magnetococcales bacterium]
MGAERLLRATWVLTICLVAALFNPLEAVAGPDAVTLTSPTGTITETTTPASIDFTWAASSGATYYKLEVTDTSGSTQYFRLWYPATDIGCSSGTGSCTATPTTTFNAGTYSWNITPYGSSGLGTSTSAVFALENSTETSSGEPSGTTTDTTPTYQWSATSSATYYQLRVVNSSGSDIHKKWYTADASGCSGGVGTCSLTPNLILSTGSYIWYTKPWTSSAGTESDGIAFVVSDAEDTTPGTPTPTTPSGAITDTTPTYSWTATENSTHYTLVVSDGTSTIINTQYSTSDLGCSVGSGTCSITPTTTLTDGTSYSWTLTPYNSTDDVTGSTSSSVDFNVDTSSLTPGTPTPTSPSGTITTLTPTYSWTATDNSNYYTLVVTDGTNLIINSQYSTGDLGCSVGSGTCSITPATNLTDGTSYSWTLTGYNSDDAITGSTSSSVAFAVDLSASSDLSPAGTLTEATTPTTITFEWPAVANSTYYKLKVFNSSGSVTYFNRWYTAANANCSGGTGSCSVTSTTTYDVGVYSWSATPYSSAGIGTVMEESFTLVNSSTSTGGSPSGTITESTPAYVWSATSLATYYKLRITDSSGSNIHNKWYSASAAGCSSGAGNCSVEPTLILLDGDYTWYTTPWTTSSGTESTGISFTVNAEVVTPDTPTPASPAGTTSDTTPTYSWAATANSTDYTLVVNSSSSTVISQQYNVSELGCEVGSGTCSITPAVTLSIGESYSWTLLPYNSTDSLSGTVSDAATFQVTIDTPGTPTPASPSGNITTKTPTYSWSATEYSTHYTLVVKDDSATEVINKQYTVDELGCDVGTGTCSVTPSTSLNNGTDYTWTLLPYNSNDEITGTISNETNFSVAITPSTPTPSSPSGETTTTTPTYTWTATANSTDYTLVVTDSGSNTIINKKYSNAELGCDTGVTCSITPDTALTDGTAYSWTLLPYNSDGPVTGTISSSVDFNVVITINTPVTPSPLAPLGTTSSTTPTYSWLATDYSTHYTLVVTDSNSNEIISTQYSTTDLGCGVGTGTCFATPTTALTAGTTYTWKLIPYNSDGAVTGTESGGIDFTVVLDTPGTPTPLSPSGTTSLTLPTYSWEATEYSTDYTLVVTDSTSTVVHNQQYNIGELGCSVGSGTCSITPTTTLTDGSTYSWTLLSYNSSAGISGTTSSSVSFTVDINDTTPETPIPASPVGNITDTTPTFSWNASANTTHYTLIVLNSASSIVISKLYSVAELSCSVGSGTCSITPDTTLNDNTDFTWSLIPYNSATATSGSASDSLSFRVGVNVPTTPTPTSPAITASSITPTYSWTSTTNSTHYTLTVMNSLGTIISTKYSASDLGCSTVGTTCSVKPASELTDGLAYTWKLTPYNSTDSLTGADSSTVAFSVVVSTNVPATPTPASPSGTGAATTTTPTFSWTATTYSSHYTLAINSSSGTLFSKKYQGSDLGCSSVGDTCSVVPAVTLTDGKEYSWTLLPYNSTDDLYGIISSAVSFSIDSSVDTPATPSPTSPSGTIQTKTPTYTWTATAYSTHYTLLVTDSVGKVISKQYTVAELGCAVGSGTCSITPSSTLVDGTTYTWTLSPYNSVDNITGTTSSSKSFTVDMSVNLTAPTGDAVTDTTPTFIWDAISSATQYSLLVQNSDGTTLISEQYTPSQANCSSGTGSCFVTPSVDVGIGTITWSITVTPDGNYGTSTFTTIIGTLDTPSIVSPNSTAEESSTSPTFTWGAVDGATAYTVNIVDSSGTIVLSGSLTADASGCASGTGTCTVTPNAVFPAGQGTWSVQATDSVYDRTSGTASTTFTIADAAVEPGAATPITPNGTETTAAPAFTWTLADNATSYKIVITDSNGNEAGNTTTTASAAKCDDGEAFCSLTFIALADGDYTWTVQSYSSETGTFGTQSASKAFTIASEVSQDPGDIAIAPTGTIYTTTPTYIWTAVSGSNNYRVKLFRNSTTTSALFRKYVSPTEGGCDTSTTCMYTADYTLTAGDYIWEVMAFPSMTRSTLEFTIPDSSEIKLIGDTVDENLTTQTYVGKFYIFTADGSNDPVVFTLSSISDGENFEIRNDDELWTADGFSPDFESSNGSYTITVTAPDGTSGTFIITVNDAGDPPTDIQLSEDEVQESVDTTSAYTIGTLSATDADTEADFLVHTYSITGGDDQASFQISGTSLQFVAGISLDNSVQATYSVEITVTDNGATYSETFTITIIDDINEAPTAITNSTNADNTVTIAASSETLTTALTVGVLVVTDPDEGDTHTLAITGGADQDLFEFSSTDSTSLQIKSGSSLVISCTDPLIVEITATDSGGLTYTETFSIIVEMDNVAPTAITLSSTVLPFMDRATSMAIGTLTTTDANGSTCDTFTYTITTDASFDGSYPNLTDYSSSFAISGDELIVVDADSEVFGVFSITITSTDSGGLSVAQTFSLSIGGFSVEDIPETKSTVAEMLAAAESTYDTITAALAAASTGDTVDLTESQIENLIIGKADQQLSDDGEFTETTTDVIRDFDLDIVSSSEIVVVVGIGVIDAIYDRLPAAVQTEADTLFSTLTPYANDDYKATIRFRIVPTVSGTTLGFDTTASYVDLLVEDSLLTPNVTFTVSELITNYNAIIATLATDNLTFFSGQNIPTSQGVDYYFPDVSSFAIVTDGVTLTK